MTVTRCVGDAPAELWTIDLTTIPTADALATLSMEEQARAARFRSAADGRRYRAAHAGLRRLIADRIGMPPSDVRFAIDRAGKPRVAGRPALHFSLSYAGDRALAGFSTHGAIGVDMERVRAIGDADELAQLHFSASEATDLRAVAPGPARDRAFLRGWTRKEACVKAVGAGLGLPTGSFTSGIGAEPRRVTLRGADTAWTVDVATIHIDDGAIAAWSIVRPLSPSHGGIFGVMERGGHSTLPSITYGCDPACPYCGCVATEGAVRGGET